MSNLRISILLRMVMGELAGFSSNEVIFTGTDCQDLGKADDKGGKE